MSGAHTVASWGHSPVADSSCCYFATFATCAGLSNKYLVDSKDSIVVQYGDISTNEQMHAHTTTSLIKKFELLPAHLTERVCSVIKVIILDTDMRVSLAK
jgi:hypothetical protein